MISMCTKFEVLSFTHAKDRMRPQNYVGHMTLIMLHLRWFVITRLILVMIYLCNFVSDIAIFVLKRDVKLQLTN